MEEQLRFDFNPEPKRECANSSSASMHKMLTSEPLMKGKIAPTGTPLAHLNRFSWMVHTIEKNKGFTKSDSSGPSLPVTVNEFVECAQKECRIYALLWYVGELKSIRNAVSEGKRLSLKQFALMYAMEGMVHPPVKDNSLRDTIRTRGDPETYVDRCIADLRMIYNKDEWP